MTRRACSPARPGSGSRGRHYLLAAAAVLAALVGPTAVAPVASAAVAAPDVAAGAVAPSTTGGELGPNVYVFGPSMSQASIQSTLNSIASEQVPNQFGAQRFAVLFEPGTYGSSTDPLIFTVGYYTSVAGLGLNPGDVVINGSINVYNQCFGSNCIALDNFWRSLSNLTINVTGNKPGGNGCSANTDFWAAAASPHQRPAVPDGLLRRLSGLRQRRVHRRLRVHRLNHHQRFPAAVGDEEQQSGWLEQRSMESGLLRG
jgi:hypothetical protein